jgi:predicted aspartyl protease
MTHAKANDTAVRREDAMRAIGAGLLSAVLMLPLAAQAAEADDAGDGPTVASAALLDGAPAGGRGLRVHADVRAAGGQAFGATFGLDGATAESVAPASVLEALGVVAEGYASYRHADGREELLPYGVVQVEFLGEVKETRVVFGPEDVEPMLGRGALGAIGLAVDAQTQALTCATEE